MLYFFFSSDEYLHVRTLPCGYTPDCSVAVGSQGFRKWCENQGWVYLLCADGLWGSHVWGESKEGFVPTRSTACLISSLRAETGSHLRKGGEFYPCQTPSFVEHSHYHQYCSLLLDRCALLAQRDHLRSPSDESSDGWVCWVGETKAHFSHLGVEKKTSGWERALWLKTF